MSDAACCACCEPVTERQEAIDSYTGTMAPDLEQVRNVGFRLIYETGAPVPVAAMADRSGLPTTEIESRLLQIEDAGRARRDPHGNLVGIAGLSLEPTPHTIEIDSRQFWTWCALDAIGIFAALGATGKVASTPPGFDHPLRIEFVKGATESQTALFIAGGYDGKDVFESWCPNVNLFDSHEAAHRWAKGHGLDGDVVAVSEVVETAGAIWASVVNGVAPNTAE